MNRMDELLEKASIALSNGRDPFNIAFLREHEVTFDECMTMSDQLALAVRVFLALKYDKNHLPLFAILMGEAARGLDEPSAT